MLRILIPSGFISAIPWPTFRTFIPIRKESSEGNTSKAPLEPGTFVNQGRIDACSAARVSSTCSRTPSVCCRTASASSCELLATCLVCRAIQNVARARVSVAPPMIHVPSDVVSWKVATITLPRCAASYRPSSNQAIAMLRPGRSSSQDPSTKSVCRPLPVTAHSASSDPHSREPTISRKLPNARFVRCPSRRIHPPSEMNLEGRSGLSEV